MIAFYMNTLSSQWKKEGAQKEYRASLVEDLKQNLSNLDRVIAAQETKVIELTEVVKSLESSEFDIDKVGAVLFKQRKSPTFFPISGTFKSLVAHSEIELFDTQLKRNLFNLYDTAYERTVYNGNLYDRTYLELYDNEIRSIMDLRSKKIDKPERLRSKAFIKNILFIIDEADSYLSLVRNSKKESEQILEMIGE